MRRDGVTDATYNIVQETIELLISVAGDTMMSYCNSQLGGQQGAPLEGSPTPPHMGHCTNASPNSGKGNFNPPLHA